MLLMVHAMMEFTVSLLVQSPRAGRRPVPPDELRQRLLAAYGAGQPYRLVEGKDCDLEIHWEEGEVGRPDRALIARGASVGRLRLLLDGQRHEVRINEVTRSYFFLVGLVGWIPRLQAYAGAQSGPPGQAMTKELSRITTLLGWSVRPVLWWFEATRRGYHVLEALTPAPLRRWPARRLWGIIYPLSYFVGIGYFLMLMGSLDERSTAILVVVSAAWWGTWGFLVWVLRGFPAFWRRTRH
jgi:hypothetical protein